MLHEIINLLTIRTESDEEFRRIKEYCSSNELPLNFQKILPIPRNANTKQPISNYYDYCRSVWGTYQEPWDIEVWNSRTNPFFGKWCEPDVGFGFSFSTTQNPPVGIILELSRQFPKVWFSLRSRDRDDPTLLPEEWYHWGMEDLWGEKCDKLLIKNGEVLNNSQHIKYYNNVSGLSVITDKTIYL